MVFVVFLSLAREILALDGVIVTFFFGELLEDDGSTPSPK
jgi:hypothetical protein